MTKLCWFIVIACLILIGFNCWGDEIDFYIKPEEPSKLYFNDGKGIEATNWIIIGRQTDEHFNTTFWDFSPIKSIERKGDNLWIIKEKSVWCLENVDKSWEHWFLYLLAH